MNVRAIIHNTIAAVALVMIGISLLFFADAVLNGGATIARYILCAVGFFGGETILKVGGEYEW